MFVHFLQHVRTCAILSLEAPPNGVSFCLAKVPASMNILLQGMSEFGTFLHAELPGVDAQITHIISVCASKATLIKILASGEVITEELNLPLLHGILQAVDATVQAA